MELCHDQRAVIIRPFSAAVLHLPIDANCDSSQLPFKGIDTQRPTEEIEIKIWKASGIVNGREDPGGGP